MQGKVVIITGASGGIGATLARTLAGKGASLVLAARRETELLAVAGRCGPNVMPVVTDVTKRPDVERLVSAALDRFGGIDVLVNNAGRGITRMPSALTDEDIDAMMCVNVKAVLYGVQAVLPHFKARGRGHIINVSSMLGRVPVRAFRSAYNGAKHFLNALTANLRDELRETHPGIVVTLVSPGIVATEFGLNAVHGGPDNRMIPGAQDVAEAAETIARVIETPRLDVYTQRGSREQVLQYFERIGDDPA